MTLFPALAILAGGDLPEGTLARLAGCAGFVAAADGAANRLIAAGVVPHLTIGDLDSLTVPRDALGEVLLVPDQDTTDADKVLAEMGKRGFTRVVLTGVEGDLPDHVLASLQSAAKCPLEVWFLFRRGFGRIVRGGESVSLVTETGARVSVVPLALCDGVNGSGLFWPLENARLDPLGATGVSNRATGGRVVLSVESGAALVFVEVAGEPIPPLASSLNGP